MNRKNGFVRCLLTPFAWLYGLAVRLRNLSFDCGILPSERYPVPVVCIGNISVGGTGKTPFTEYLVGLLKKQYRVASLSRGYKRRTKGFIIADADCSAREVGDEACQIKHKFPDITVAVDTNRRRGISRLLALPDDVRPEVILLDDGMQHRYVRPSLTVMLTDYNNMYYDDKILPVGNLREPVDASYRADIIVVTKCGDVIKPIDLRIIEKQMAIMAYQRLYFSNVRYKVLEAVFPSCALSPPELSDVKDILLVAGIANPQPLVDKLKSCSSSSPSPSPANLNVCLFPDHHDFGVADIKHIDNVFRKMPADSLIISTEKDAMRLKTLDFLPADWKQRLYYLPISVEFLFERGENFDAEILKHIVSTINIYKKNVKD
ncbi:MAG: tetraacyldisaccharide 4'-kinase [Tannerella sp.]|nr:tetraacyldisaccharide 4'-kinase [Tannerella sp.]